MNSRSTGASQAADPSNSTPLQGNPLVTLDGALDTLLRIGEYLGIDYTQARKAPGKPSDVFIQAIEARIEQVCKDRATQKQKDREDAPRQIEQLRVLITEFGIACADSGAVEMHMLPQIIEHAPGIEGRSA